jgi:hypothetical protein
MKFSANNEKLKSVTVFLEFDPRLQPLTGISRTPIEITEGTPFIMLLHAVLDSYPDLARNYAFNMLGFEVNGKIPKPFVLLDAHDVVSVCLSNYSDFNDGNDSAYYQ